MIYQISASSQKLFCQEKVLLAGRVNCGKGKKTMEKFFGLNYSVEAVNLALSLIICLECGKLILTG